MSSNFNKIREKFQELGDNDTNKGDYRNGYLQALNDAIDIVKLFAIPDVSATKLPVCDHKWKEHEDEECNAQMRCTKCKVIKRNNL